MAMKSVGINVVFRMAMAVAMSCDGGHAVAQSYPEKTPVRLINSFVAGGGSDTIARVIADGLGKIWGTSVVVENRPGATGFIAAEQAAKAAPDGNTIFMIDPQIMSMNPALFSKLPYDPVKDFAAVINIGQFASVLVASSAFPANSLKETIALAKANPGEVNYGSSGIGSFTHLYQEEFAALAGIKLTHIPYKGNAEVLKAVLGNEIQLTLSGVLTAASPVKQSKIKAIAVGASKRDPLLPDVPTFAEEGIPFNSVAWLGLAVPSATPRRIVEKLAADVSRVITAKEFQDRFLASLGLEVLNQGPDEFARFLKADRAKYESYVKRVNLRLD